MPEKKLNRGATAAVKAIKKFIDTHPANGISTAALAREHNISRNVLQEVFKEKFEVPIGQYKLNARMEEALRLIKSGYSIKEVSFKMNYSSPSSFSNAFRNYYDISALEWVHNMKSNTNKQGKSGLKKTKHE
jgi:AraC family transcriptional regulator